ncbi:MAG: MFS transporter [Actinoallomurus sp.]
MDVLSEIRQSRMSRFQVVAVAIALALILINGYDVAVMAYAAPVLSRDWHIDPVTLGYLLSAGLFGMAAGSIFLTPLADRIGRRKLTIISLTIISIGMVLSVFSTGAMLFAAWPNNGERTLTTGTYEDTLTLTSDGWRFAKRIVTLD